MNVARLHWHILAVAFLSIGAVAWADEPGTGSADNGTLSWTTNGDVDLYSDYIARGLTYSDDKIALQARIEGDAPNGAYVGMGFNQRTVVAGSTTMELDPYGGMVFKVKDLAVDIGVFSWYFPNGRFPVSGVQYDTAEATVALTYREVSVKVWYDLTDYFGLQSASALPNYGIAAHGSSQGSLYSEANVTVPVFRSTKLAIHAGYQTLHDYPMLDYFDWRLALEQSFDHGFVLGVGRTDTNANPMYYTDRSGNNTARAKWVGYVRWVFP